MHYIGIKNLKTGIISFLITFFYTQWKTTVAIFTINTATITSLTAREPRVLNIETSYSMDIGVAICISIVSLIVTVIGKYILDGILADKEAWLTIKLDVIKEKVKFKKGKS